MTLFGLSFSLHEPFRAKTLVGRNRPCVYTFRKDLMGGLERRGSFPVLFLSSSYSLFLFFFR